MHLDDATLNEYLDGRLDRRQVAVSDRHLAACARCRSRLQALERLTVALERWPDAALGRDLSGPVMARLRSGSPRIALGWLTLVEALGATGLMTFFWPRLVEITAPIVNGPSIIALTMWLEWARVSLMTGADELIVGLASLTYAFELWIRQPAQVTGVTIPVVAVLGAAALALGLLGNGFLLRASPAGLGRPLIHEWSEPWKNPSA